MERTLTFYDPSLPLKLDTDASSVGVGAVLSHIMKNGEERPVEFISRTLSSSERNYSQIDKEGLSIVWAMKRFRMYLFGREFQLVTDHKPLVHIFGDKPMGDIAASRVARWALFMQQYDYKIEYRPTAQHSNCDMMSRFPVEGKHSEATDEVTAAFSVSLQDTGLDADLVARETKRVPILSKVLHYVMDGWPVKMDVEGDLKVLWNRHEELTVELGCITLGIRVVVPSKLRSDVLEMLHVTHAGMSGMKRLARSYVYWPRIETDIQELARTCESCGRHGPNLPKLTDHPWTRATGPWQKIHIDFCGEFQNNMWLCVIDSYSKWPEIVKMGDNITSKATIRALRNIFSRCGIPLVLVSDNGPSLTSREIEEFFKANKIKHIKTPTYSPKSNGMAEKLVGIFKSSMKKLHDNCKDVDKNLANFLLNYRNQPHSVTGQPPSVLMYNRTLRYGLHLIRRIRPDDKTKVQNLQPDKEQQILDSSIVRSREFRDKQLVWVRSAQGNRWEKAVIHKKQGENVYDINLDGRIVSKHADKLKSRVIPVISLTKSKLPADLVPRKYEYVGNGIQHNNQPLALPTVDQSPICRESVPTVETRANNNSEHPEPQGVSSSTAEPPSSFIVRRSTRLASKNPVNYKI